MNDELDIRLQGLEESIQRLESAMQKYLEMEQRLFKTERLEKLSACQQKNNADYDARLKLLEKDRANGYRRKFGG